MADCKIFLTLGDNAPLEFNSNRELDTYLWENRETLLAGEHDPEVFFDISRSQEMNLRVKKLADLGKKYEATLAAGHIKNIDELGDVAIGVGLSNLFDELGNPRDMSLPGRESLNGVLTEQQRNFRTDFGSDLHKIVEARLSGGSPSLKLLSKHPTILRKVEAEVDKMLDFIKNKHTVNGKKPTLYTETRLVSKNVDPAFLDVIRNSDLVPSWSTGNTSDIRQSWGKADLIVVDDSGNVWVYDMKTTGSSIMVGTRANQGNELNLGSYVAMCNQWDIPAKSGGFLEFNTSFSPDGLSITDIKWNTLRPFNTGATLTAAKTYFPSNVAHPIEAIDETETIVSRVVPNNTFMSQHTLLELDANEEKKKKYPVQDSEPIHRYRPNAKYKYYVPINRIPKGLNRNWMYANYIIGNTEEELNQRIEEYVALANEMDTDILPLVADAIVEASATRNTLELQQKLRNISKTNYENIYNQIKRYVNNGWVLLNDDVLIQNGLFLFQKPNSAIVDLVMVDTHALNLPLSFNVDPTNKNKDANRTSILGQFLRDDKVDPMYFMQGTVGNAVLLKGFIYLNQHPEILSGNKIANIKAISVKDAHTATISNKRLERTYTRLMQEYNKKYKDHQLQLYSNLLMDDVSSAVVTCHEILQNAVDEEARSLINYKAFKSVHPDAQYTIDELEKRLMQIQRLKPTMDSSRMSAENEIQMAKRCLQRGLMSYRGLDPVAEEDVGAYVTGTVALEGTEASSMKESRSVVLRQLQTVISGFHDVYKQEFEHLAALWQNKYDKFRKEAGISLIAANDFQYFRDNWFVKDNGKIHKSMQLIREDDPYWNGKPAEKELYDLYMSFWRRLRYNDDVQEIQEAKQDGSYYEIPLVRTNFKKQLAAGGFWDAVKGTWARAKRDAAGLFFDLQTTSDVIEQEEENRLEAIKLPSYIKEFVGNDRRKAIEKYGTSAYETNMDIIALTVLAVGLRSEMSAHAMMLCNAIRANAYYEHIVDHNTMQGIIDALDAQLNSKMFQRSVIDSHLRGIAMLINFCKGITSTGTLAFSWKSFTRETIRGITDMFSRIQWDEMYSSKFGYRDYLDALKIILEEGPKNIKVNSFIMQLSHNFGMANFSGNQIVEASKSNRYGVFELGSDVMFITATWPDFIHRTAMLVAHLKHIGAYDAYSLDENDVLTYDMTKDQRFQTWLKYKDDETKVPDSDFDKYIQERDLYRELLADFDNAGKRKPDGTKYEEGDLLPEALSPRTQDNLKTVADRAYGNYDDETKSLMQKRLLGALFFQFKTFPLERLSQWFKSPTHINDITYEQQYWDDGEPIIGYFTEDNRVELGRLSDIDKNWLMTGRAWYLKYPNGHQVMGHIHRAFAVAGYLLNHNQAELEDTWKTNPYFRGQLALGLYDTLFGVLLAFLIRIWFGEETVQNMKNEEWYTRWLYAVGTGMTQDGPVWSLIGNIIGNGAPPSLSILRQYMTNAASVITGDTSLIYGFANSLGATREFTNLLTDE